jgi:miniconductance mechanosensitive channel
LESREFHLVDNFVSWLASYGIAGFGAKILAWAVSIIIVFLVAYAVNFIVKRLVLRIIRLLILKSRSRWDDAFVSRHLFSRVSHLAPALVIYFFAPAFPEISQWIIRFSIAYVMIVGLVSIYALLSALGDVYYSFDIARDRPIKGYIQVVKILLGVIAGILVISVIINRSPTLLLGGIGALTAVIILVFKDTILGFIASIQLSSNNMVRIGDWIEMPKYGADGDVIDMTLATVKVRNWDKTITTIPTYAMISDSFKNWRGMQESGGRRIKRAINIDMNSVKFVGQEMYDRFMKIQLLRDYLISRREEIDKYNAEHDVDTSELVNGRNMTNLGTFRAYMVAYLKNHPKIHNDMTFMVRHLPPGPQGIPVEIYVFSNDQVWANYESIQADIFDHILAVIPRFDLRVFQSPSGGDLQELAARLNINN